MLVVLVSAGWSWLLRACGVGVGVGGAGVAAGGGAGGGAPPRNSETRVRLYTVCIRTYVILDIAQRQASAALQFCLI